MTKPQTLGQRIAQARREKGVRDHRDVTHLDLAKAVGVSGTAVSDWEADKKVPREAALTKLAAYLGVTPAYLRYGVSESADVLSDRRAHRSDVLRRHRRSRLTLVARPRGARRWDGLARLTAAG